MNDRTNECIWLEMGVIRVIINQKLVKMHEIYWKNTKKIKKKNYFLEKFYMQNYIRNKHFKFILVQQNINVE